MSAVLPVLVKVVQLYLRQCWSLHGDTTCMPPHIFEWLETCHWLAEGQIQFGGPYCREPAVKRAGVVVRLPVLPLVRSGGAGCVPD